MPYFGEIHAAWIGSVFIGWICSRCEQALQDRGWPVVSGDFDAQLNCDCCGRC